jgi:3-hydroxyisobutyrate dehydrogenase-like beta-hydroxyacid dehydrogenase
MIRKAVRVRHPPVPVPDNWRTAGEAEMAETVGLIGVGLVGTALAENLIAAGYAVVGFDPDPERQRRLREIGGTVAVSGRAVAGLARRVLLSLPDTDIVLQALEGAGGLVQAPALPSHIVDTTTGDPDSTVALAGRMAERGVAFLDATISGSSAQIGTREAVIMCGGGREAFHACRDLLDAIADRCFYLGPSGSGSRAKLASNLILGLNRLVLAEGLVFAESLGLDPAAFLTMVRTTPAYSRAMDVKGHKMLEQDFTPQSRVAQHHKDLRIILEYAARAGQELPLARVHHKILSEAIGQGRGELDTSAVILQIRERRTPRRK